MLIRNVVARHHTMLRRDGNAEKFWSVARRCTTRNQLEAVSNIRWHTGSPFVALFGPVHLVPCRTFSALKMFDTFLEDSRVSIEDVLLHLMQSTAATAQG
jgi:hypothetical protein